MNEGKTEKTLYVQTKEGSNRYMVFVPVKNKRQASKCHLMNIVNRKSAGTEDVPYANILNGYNETGKLVVF